MPTTCGCGCRAGWRVGVAAEANQGAGLIHEIRAAWSDLRGSIRAKRAQGAEESQLLFYVFLASTVGFITGLPSAVIQAQGLTEEGALTGVIFGRFFAAVFIAPLFFYGLAALSRGICRIFGGKGQYREARLGLFWALVVTIPVMIANGLAVAVLADAPMLLNAVSLALTAVFLWVWAVFIAEIEYFRSPIPAFGTMIAVLAGLLVILLIIPGV